MVRTLLVVAGLFFSVCAASLLYFATSGPGHEYDLKFVLPIDARQMPQAASPPAVVSHADEAEPNDTAAPEGRAEAGNAPAIPDRAPVQFGDRPGAASEARTAQ